MLYARDELNNIVRASKGAIAFCPGCNQQLRPKCGSVKIHHWAHTANDCDLWMEPITQWHLDWQEYANLECREVVMRKGDEHHRADIRTKAGVVVEIQHSTISQTEIAEREQFYGDMCWVFDLTKPSNRYGFLHRSDLDEPDVLPVSEVLDGNDLRQCAESLKSTPLEWMLGERINEDNIRRSSHQPGKPFRYTVNFERGDPILGESYEHTGPVSPVRKATPLTGLIPFIGWYPVKYRTAIFQWKNPKKHVLACQKPVFLDFGSPHWLLYIDQTEIGPSLYRSNRFLGVIIPKANFVDGVIQAQERRLPTQSYSFIASAWADDIVTRSYGLSSGAAGVMHLKQRQIQQQKSVMNALEERQRWSADIFRQRKTEAAAHEARKQEVERVRAESQQRFSAEYWVEIERLWEEAVKIVAPGARRGSSTRHWELRRLKPSSAMDAIRRYGQEADGLKARVKALMMIVRYESEQSEAISAMHDADFYASLENPLEMMQSHRASAAKVSEEYEQLDQDCFQFIQQKQEQQAEKNRQQYEEMLAAKQQAAKERAESSFTRFSDDYWAEVSKGYIACKTSLSLWDTYLFQSAHQKVIERALKATGVKGLSQQKEAKAIQSGFSDIRKAIAVIKRAESDSYIDMPDPLHTIKELLAKIEITTTRYKALEQQFPRLQRERRKAETTENEAIIDIQRSLF